MYSRRGLIALGMLAGVSVSAVIVDGWSSRTPVRDSRRVLPEYATSGGVGRIVWRRAGQTDFELVVSTDGAFSMPDSRRAVIDRRAADEVLATLETMTFARRERVDSSRWAVLGLAAPRVRMHVHQRDGRVLVLSLGVMLPGIDRGWLGRHWTTKDGRPFTGERDAYLVDGHLLRALDRRERDIRARRVFDVFRDHITDVQIDTNAGSLHIEGRPLLVQTRAGRVELSRDALRALADMLNEIAIDRFGPRTSTERGAASPSVSIRVRRDEQTLELAVLGPCPDDSALVLVDTSIGTGCLAFDHIERIEALLGDPTSLFAQAVLPGGRPSQLIITASAGTRVAIRASGTSWRWVDDGASAIEAEAVDEWLSHLKRAASGAFVWLADVGIAAMPSQESMAIQKTEARWVMTIDARYAGDRRDVVHVLRHQTLGLLARRNDEPIGLRLDVAEHAAALIPVHPLRFSRRQLLSREPFGLRRATAMTYRSGRPVTVAALTRGELLEDWRVSIPSGRRPRSQALEHLRELGRLRALDFEHATILTRHGLTPPRRRIRVTFDRAPGEVGPDRRTPRDGSPIGASEEGVIHIIDVGAATERGCYARLDARGAVFLLDRDACAALLGPWSE